MLRRLKYPCIDNWSLYVDDRPDDWKNDQIRIVYSDTDEIELQDDVTEGIVEDAYQMTTDPDLWIVRVGSGKPNDITTYELRMSDCSPNDFEAYKDWMNLECHLPRERDLKRFWNRSHMLRVFLEEFMLKIQEQSERNHENAESCTDEIDEMFESETDEPEPNPFFSSPLGTGKDAAFVWDLKDIFFDNPKKDKRWWV